MAEQELPRRMKRFYRGAEGRREMGGESEGAGQFGASLPQGPRSSLPDGRAQEDEGYGPSGRKLLQSIPGMEYEDLQLDQKNYEDLKKIEQKDLEEKIALLEVERFKKENKRLPTKQESGQLAETIFNQLKNSPPEEAYPEVAQQKGIDARAGMPLSRREQRAAKRRGNESGMDSQGRAPAEEAALQQAPRGRRGRQQEGSQAAGMQPQPAVAAAPLDIKKLLDEEPSAKGKSIGSEFDLGLGGEGEEGIEPLEDIEEGGGAEKIEDIGDFDIKAPGQGAQKCPNCGAETDKIVYCPKCGTAFCGSCAKAKGAGEYICPKCGNITKA